MKTYAENLSNREALKVILRNAMGQVRLERTVVERLDVPGNVAYANMETGAGMEKVEEAAKEEVKVKTKTDTKFVFGARNLEDVPGNASLMACKSQSDFKKLKIHQHRTRQKRLRKIEKVRTRSSLRVAHSSVCVGEWFAIFAENLYFP